MYLIFESFMLIALAGLIAVFYHDLFLWIVLLKGITSLCFVLTGVYGYARNKNNRMFSRTMLIAFVCSMIGDVFLAIDKTQGLFFVLGVVSFAAAHVLFFLTFSKVSPLTKTDIAGIAVLFIAMLPLLIFGDFEYHGLLPVLIIYAVIISSMCVKALSLWRCRAAGIFSIVLIMCGGVLFLLSDVVLLFWLFGKGMPKEVQAVNWVLYYAAQGCLSASICRKDFSVSTKK